MPSVVELAPSYVDNSIQAPHTRVDRVLHMIGFTETLSPNIQLRLALLDRFTPTVDDEIRAISLAGRVFEQAEAAGRPYTDIEQRAVVMGTLFSDIGKSGPRRATLPQADLVVSIYAQENITPDELAGTVTDFFRRYCTNGQSEEQLAVFRSLHLDPNGMTMRDFYNLHSSWTLDILWGETRLPQEVIAVAASHHRLRDDNPRGIFNDDDTYRFPFGGATRYGRAEKLVSLLDQYDAFRRRSGLSRTETVEKLREIVNGARGGRYANDAEFAEIITDIDLSLGQQDKINGKNSV